MMSGSPTASSDPTLALAELLEMDENDRISAVAEDLRTGSDRYSSIDPRDLAEVLGVPRPDMGESSPWAHFVYVEKTWISELMRTGKVALDDLLDMIENHLSPERYAEFLLSTEDGTEDIPAGFLTAAEEELLASEYAEERITNGNREYIPSYSQCGVRSDKDEYLAFETELCDWGELSYFFGPYEARDGKFVGPPDNAFILCLNDDSIEET